MGTCRHDHRGGPTGETCMRYVLFLWALPMGIIWGWYFLSLNDINFGFLILSRLVHDAVFDVYGQILGVDPETIPLLLAQACIFDTALIGAIFAFRRRRQLIALYKRQKLHYFGESEPESV